MPLHFDFALNIIQSGVKQMTFKRPTPAGWAVLAIGALCAVGFVDAAIAQTAAPAAAPAADAAAAAPAAAAAVPNKGDTAWMLVSSALVLMMSVPGLALFYGGLVRTKNMASVLTQVFAIVAMVGVVWTLYGYSLAFGDGGSMTPYIGGFTKAFMHGIDANSTAATFSNGVVIPELAYFVFQMTFAMITPALIVGAFAERIKFSAVMLFILLWVTFIYFPIAHWVWYVAAPDDVAAAAKALAAAADGAAKTAAQAKLDEVTGAVGWLAGAGALDFAGGTVVHINAGIAGLVGALIIGKRTGYGKDLMAPHSLTMTMIGASLLWVGWLVRLQRRIEPRSQRHDGAGLRQHHGGHRRCGAVLAALRMDRQGQALVAGHLLRRGCGSGGGDAGFGLRRSDRGAGARPRGLAGLPVLRLHGEERTRL
jgi:ammonium transporter, Amt family